MTKAFLEAMVLKPENEKFVREAFGEKCLKKVKAFEKKRAAELRRKSERKLSIHDLAILN